MSTTTFNRDALLAQANALLNKPGFSKEDKAKFDGLISLADTMGAEGRRLKLAKLAAAELDMGIRSNENSGASEIEKEFRQFLQHGDKALLSDRSRMLMAGRIEGRAQGVGSGSIGGYIVPASFVDVFESSLIATDPLFAVATMFETATGSTFNHPLEDDQGVAAQIVPENSTSTETDTTIAAGIAWGLTPMWRSGEIIASMELVADSRFDIASLVAKVSGIRLARGIGRTFVSTLLSGAVSGLTSASPTAIAGDELIDLMSSVDSAYAANGSWLMSFATYATILKLKGASSGDYLFPASVANGRPTLLGFPVYLSPSMPALGATNTPISFGDHSRFMRRQVENSLQVRVYVERHAEVGQITYESFWRVDGALMKAPDYGSPTISQSPVKFITMHS